MSSSVALPGEIVEWVESLVGGTLTSAVRMAGGGRKQAWFVDVETPGGSEALFLRWDPTGISDRGDPWTVRREAAVYRALDGSGLPVAGFIGLHPTAEAMLVTRLPGTAGFSRLRDEAEREHIASEFMGHIAALHQLDPVAIGLASDRQPLTVPELVREQLAEMDGIIEARPGPVEPVFRLALDWLRTNIPAYEGPVVVVQGDTGPGNFMFEHGAVTAIVDWELAHLGDPMDDLAWISLRSTQEPFPDLPARFAEYQNRSGHLVDADRIRYYRVLAEAKILSMNHGQSVRDRSAGEGGGGDPGARLIFGQLHRRLCAEALAEVMKVELDTTVALPDREPDEDTELFALVLDQIRDVVTPRITDSLAQQRIKGLARALKYLATASRYRAEVDAAEAADLAAVLRTPPAPGPAGGPDAARAGGPDAARAGGSDAALAGRSVGGLPEAREAFARAMVDGRIRPEDALRVVYRQLLRQNELLRGSSGVLADRHYAPLPS